MKTYHKSGVVANVTASGAAIASGAVVILGALLGVAGNLIADGRTGPVYLAGVVKLTKLAGEAWTQGQRLFWDSVAEKIQVTPTSQFAGIAFIAAASADTTGYVDLNVGQDLGRTGVIADPGDGEAIPVTGDGNCPLVSAGAETRTLAAPSYVGQEIDLTCKTYVGDITLTVATTVNQTANNTLVFGVAGDTISLHAVEIGANLRWRVGSNDGVALSTV